MMKMLRSVWRRLKGLKAWMGFYGDLLVFAGVYLFVRYVVPFGKVITDVLTLVFVLMVLFSVFYIAWAKVKKH